MGAFADRGDTGDERGGGAAEQISSSLAARIHDKDSRQGEVLPLLGGPLETTVADDDRFLVRDRIHIGLREQLHSRRFERLQWFGRRHWARQRGAALRVGV